MPDEFGGVEIGDEFGGIAIEDEPRQVARVSAPLLPAGKPIVATPGTTFTTPPASLEETPAIVGWQTPLINPRAVKTAIDIGSAGMGRAPIVEGFREGAAQQLAGFTSPESIAMAPAFAVPVVGPALALGLGAKAVGTGLGTTVGALESGNMAEAGHGLSEVVGGGTMLLGGGHQAFRTVRPELPPVIPGAGKPVPKDVPQQLEKAIEPEPIKPTETEAEAIARFRKETEDAAREMISEEVARIDATKLKGAEDTAAQQLTKLLRRAGRFPALRPALPEAFKKVADAAREQGADLEAVQRGIGAEMQSIYGADAPEMVEFYFGKGKAPEASPVLPAPEPPIVPKPTKQATPRFEGELPPLREGRKYWPAVIGESGKVYIGEDHDIATANATAAKDTWRQRGYVVNETGEFKSLTQIARDAMDKQSEPPVAKPATSEGTYAAQAKVIADKLREQFKTDTGGKVFTGPVQIINAAVELAAKMIEKGGSAADAMAAALKHIKENWRGEFDEQDFRVRFENAIKIPDTTGENVKMRKSAESALESPMIPEPVQERIETAPESRYTQQSMTRVEDAVKSMSDAELGAIPADSNLFVASRLEQADRRFKAGNNDAGYQIFVELEKQGTAFGQNINQFKRLAGTKPEHVAVLVDKKLEAAGKDPLTPEQRTKVIDTSRVSKEADAALDKSTAQWEKNPTDANAKKAETALENANNKAVELQALVSKFQPRSTSSVLKSVLQGNLLTPISEVANLFGNMIFLPFRALDRAIASGLDILDSKLRNKPREVSVQPVAGTVEAAKGAGRGLKQVPAILARGTGNVIKGETRAGLHPIQAWINQFSKNPEMPTTKGRLTLKDRLNLAIEGTFGVPAEAMLRGLGAGDVPFREAARARVIAEQLKLQGVPRSQWAFAQKFPELFLTKDSLATVQKETMSAIFQRDSKTLNLMTNWLKGKGEILDFMAATVAPYKLTPWNIIGEILSYNPLIAMARGVVEAKKGNTRSAKLNAGKMVVGSMLTGAGIWLYKNGLMAPSLDERDEAQKARILSGKVLPPNHINISGLKRAMSGGNPAFQPGDETVDVFRAGGLAGAMFYMTANIGRDMERGPKTTDADMWMSILRQSTLEQARFGLNQSFLSGIEGLLTAIKEGNGDNFLRQWASTVTSIPLPNFLNTLSRASRQYQPDMKAEGFKGKIENIVKGKLGFSGLDDYLPLKRDFWGQPMRETPEGRNAIFYHFFDISKNKQVTSDPVELELYRLWRRTGDTKVIPSIPMRSVTFQNKTYPLSPELYEKYVELVGQNRRQITGAMTVNSSFYKLNDEQKIKMLERAYDRGADRGRAIFYREYRNRLVEKPPRAGFQSLP